MAMPAGMQDKEWTVERALALPEDGNRYEVLDGELFVTPSPTWGHQAAIGALFAPLREYVRAHGLGWTMLSPADIVFSPRRLVQPDLFVVPWREGGSPHSWTEVKSLLLAVEVLSPSTARADRHRKRVIYQNEGVPEYWIIDGDARLVERWRAGDERPEILDTELTWRPRAELSPFRLPLKGYFAESAG
jgi:Uma2 family endonuclease